MKALLVILFSVQSVFSYAQLAAGEKIALVIGISNYEGVPILKNCVNDGTGMTKKLTGSKFKTISLPDATREEIIHALDSLTKTLKPEDTFLYYFSGHGMEFNGENYLFPKDAKPTSEKDIPEETVPLEKVLQVIKVTRVKTAIIILDACRNNTIVKTWRGRMPKEGLANIVTPSGIFIGYAAAPGRAASGGIRSNSLYTEAILKFIDIPNITIDEMFTKVNKEVRDQSFGLQVPHKMSSLQEEFYFNSTIPGLSPEYKNVSLDSIAKSSINKLAYSRKDSIEVSLEFKDDTTWSKISPVWVSIVRKSAENYGRSVYNDKVYIGDKNRNIRIGNFLVKGVYELMIGVYLLADTDKGNPTLYYKKFCFGVM